MTSLAIIPARYNSSRLPGKPLVDIFGKSMIQRVYEQAKQSLADKLIVATDDYRVEAAVTAFGGQVMMTSDKHLSGTDRCAEVLDKIKEKVDVVINIQGDEPFINPSQINQLITAFDTPTTQIATLAKQIEAQSEIEDEHTAKVQFDDNFWATSFDRVVSYNKATTYYKHIGLYAFRPQTLLEISQLPPTDKEHQLRLEQWRWLDHQYKIKVQITSVDAYAVDTPDDLKKVIQRFG